MIASIIFSIFTLLLFKNFKKYLIIITAISVILSQFSILSGTTNLYSFLSLLVIPISLIKNREAYRRHIYTQFPFKFSFILLSTSIVLSYYLNSDKHYSTLLLSLSELFVILNFWTIIKQNPIKYSKIFLKASFVFGSIIAIYSIFETFSRTNPYISLINNLDLYTSNVFISETRFGLKRSQSIFSMHTTNGGISLLLLILFLSMKQIKKIKYTNNNVNVIIILLIMNIFFTGSRAAIIGCIISLFTFYKTKYIKSQYLIPAIILVIILSPLLFSYLTVIYDSIINTDKVSGSSTEMRTTQFEIALFFLLQSFWFGNGLSYTWNYAQTNFKELYGAESLWLPIMIDQGIVGILAYIFFIVNCIYYVYKYNQPKLTFFIIGFTIFQSLSSIPYVSFFLMAIYLIVIIEISQYYRFNMSNINTKN